MEYGWEGASNAQVIPSDGLHPPILLIEPEPPCCKCPKYDVMTTYSCACGKLGEANFEGYCEHCWKIEVGGGVW